METFSAGFALGVAFTLVLGAGFTAVLVWSALNDDENDFD